MLAGTLSGRGLGSGRAGTRVAPHRQAVACHIILGLGDGKFAEMKDRGGKHCARAAVANALDEMIERAGAARSDDRNRNRAGHGAGEGEIKTAFGAVAVHRGQKNFARAERHDLLRIGQRIKAGRTGARHG